MVTRPAGARGSYHRGREERLAEGIQSRLLEHASRDPRAPFLLAPGRAPMSYGLMAEHVEHLGERFGAWGIARGDIVVMPAFDRAIACMMLAAAPCASAIALLPTSLGVDGCGELLDRMHPRAVLVPGVETPLGAAAAARGIARIEVASAGDAAGAFSLSLADAGSTLDGSSPRHDPRWAHIGITSGTTARPKIVPCRHDALLAITAAIGELFALGPGDASGLVTPIHLANGQRSAFLLPVLHGGRAECLPEADVGALLDAIRAIASAISTRRSRSCVRCSNASARAAACPRRDCASFASRRARSIPPSWRRSSVRSACRPSSASRRPRPGS
jgi:acyl-CoA synthetase (AMP-forming)/AMP-acid ligase II